ncbi:iron transporter, partial [Salmonella enterica]
MRHPIMLATATLLLAPLAQAKEYPIGEPQQCGGMEVGAVYLQPVEMDPAGMMRAAAESDVHL